MVTGGCVVRIARRPSTVPAQRVYVAEVRPTSALVARTPGQPPAVRRTATGPLAFVVLVLLVALVGLATVRGTLAPFAWGLTLGGALGFMATLIGSEVAVGRARARGRRYWEPNR